jgi:hypothetical protein
MFSCEVPSESAYPGGTVGLLIARLIRRPRRRPVKHQVGPPLTQINEINFEKVTLTGRVFLVCPARRRQQ